MEAAGFQWATAKKSRALMSNRTSIPERTFIELMLLNAHACCICKDFNKTNIVVHHIDGNNKNHVISNLAVLCPDHHDMVEAKRKLTGNNLTKAPGP